MHALVENLRLLEAFVTAPLGLYSDIRMAREALPLDEARELPRSESQQRRIGYRRLSERPGEVALKAIAQIRLTLDIIESLSDDAAETVSPSWTAQARRVLARAEQKVGMELRAETAARAQGLYVIVDPEATRGRPVIEMAGAVLEGGASLVQLRDKTGNPRDTLQTAREIKALCERYDALFIVNDDPAIALTSGASGLHLGQGDMPVAEARRVTTAAQIIGRSNNNMEEVAASQAAGADYIAVGAVFPTSTMGKARRPVVGTKLVQEAKRAADQPIVAIGGITKDNAAEVMRSGADGICAVGAVTLADDPRTAAAELVDAMQSAPQTL